MPDPTSDRFSRCVDLYGPDGFGKIRLATVVVFGLGGVGSHAAHALARSGVGGLRLVDFDSVTASSLNRNPFAGPADLGRAKVEVAAESLTRNCPDTHVTTDPAFFDTETADQLLRPPIAAVVDAIDSLNPKIALLEHCVRAGLPVFSSMGASSRRDFTRVETGDISQTRICPLASRVRKFLRRRGIESGVSCVYSTETPAEPLAPDLDEPRLDRGRVRNRLASQMSLPGIFGYALASLVLDFLAGKIAEINPGSEPGSAG